MKEQMNGGESNNVWTVGVGMLIAGLVVGFVIGWYWQKGTSEIILDDSQTNATSTDLIDDSSMPKIGNVYQTIEAQASVSIDDQRAGNLAFVKRAEVSKPTWVAVREIVDGSIGNILGARMVTGEKEDVPISLLRPTKADSEYAVFLYQDNGDGRFDFKTDLLVTEDEQPIATTFTAQ